LDYFSFNKDDLETQFIGSLIVWAADVAILVLNLLIQKDFDFEKIWDIEDWGTLEKYMLLAPLISQLIQPAFLSAALLLSVLNDMQAFNKRSFRFLFWIL